MAKGGSGAIVKDRTSTSANSCNIFLWNACRSGDVYQAKDSIAKGANPSCDFPFKHVPLHRAAQFGHMEIVKLLVAAGAKEDRNRLSTNGKSPIHLATEAGHTRVADFLGQFNVKLRTEY
jgi:ankyrin repeat protein